ncbi:MAG TPA: methylmalonyl Co-A mutase-associated GTPase MeaB [Oligoflexia bacterium]|nr:methylmalonyl Co-A mutase-associated GTPase MeaB [Oligoflexia bacterium]HMP49545.1 methylmalonyl Co-A mutase-associated GTPase MeaB [Oligoflexia bacterium]
MRQKDLSPPIQASVSNLSKRVCAGERRAIARALTIIENDLESSKELGSSLFASGGSAKILGITGAPGAGKSTLIDSLIEELLKDNLKVAVLAIDPSSPFSGGALLGDRARMLSSALEEKIFIRSAASRGQLGGLSPRTPELIHVLDAAGFHIIIVETVGVGQAELDIMRCADVVTVVLSPHTGDSLQALKAGIIEIADIFALNKADLIGINELEKDLMLSLSLSPSGKKTPVIARTEALKKEGISNLKNEIIKYYLEIEENGELKLGRQRSLEFQMTITAREILSTKFFAESQLKKYAPKILSKVFNRKLSPREAALELIDKHKMLP